MNELLFLTAISLVAFLYSSVGHGGATGYLALMMLFGFAPDEMRASAFVLNIFVASIAFLCYSLTGKFQLRKLFPFITGSVPSAFLGSLIRMEVNLYSVLLGIILLFGVIWI